MEKKKEEGEGVLGEVLQTEYGEQILGPNPPPPTASSDPSENSTLSKFAEFKKAHQRITNTTDEYEHYYSQDTSYEAKPLEFWLALADSQQTTT